MVRRLVFFANSTGLNLGCLIGRSWTTRLSFRGNVGARQKCLHLLQLRDLSIDRENDVPSIHESSALEHSA